MCSFPFHPIPFVPILPCSIRFPSPVFPVGCGVDVLCTTISGLVVGPKGKARGLGWVGPKPCLVFWSSGGEEERSSSSTNAFRSPLFFPFFGSLEACMGRSGCSGYLFRLFFTPPFSRSPSRFFLFRKSGRLPFFVSLLLPLPFLFSFSSFALVSISLSLFLFPFSLCVDILRLFVTWTDLPFSFFSFFQISNHLPAHIRVVQKSGHPVAWICDPMHGKWVFLFFSFDYPSLVFLLSWIRVSQPQSWAPFLFPILFSFGSGSGGTANADVAGS